MLEARDSVIRAWLLRRENTEHWVMISETAVVDTGGKTCKSEGKIKE